MSDFTPANLYANIESSIDLSTLTIDTSLDHDDISEMVLELIREIEDSTADVTYYHEAWAIIGGSDWDEYTESEYDLEGCTDAMQAVMRQAGEIVGQAFSSLAADVANEIATNILHLIDTALDEGYEGKVTVSAGTCHGWAVHDKEDEEGVCFYSHLEGEQGLTALEYHVGNGAHASVIWNK
ncbi:MAG: hypothetical protein JKX78_02985 [Alteromonadaceae bacterium]|nr:hypothetical protein [Alteromonadaceae bacterium]